MVLSTFLLKRISFHRVLIVKLPKLKQKISGHPIYGFLIECTTIYRGYRILFLHQKISERRAIYLQFPKSLCLRVLVVRKKPT